MHVCVSYLTLLNVGLSQLLRGHRLEGSKVYPPPHHWRSSAETHYTAEKKNAASFLTSRDHAGPAAAKSFNDRVHEEELGNGACKTCCISGRHHKTVANLW